MPKRRRPNPGQLWAALVSYDAKHNDYSGKGSSEVKENKLSGHCVVEGHESNPG